MPWAWERSGSLSRKTASTTCWSFAMASETDEGLLSVSTPCVTVLTALGVLISLKDTARGGVLVWPLLAVALGPFPPAGVVSTHRLLRAAPLNPSLCVTPTTTTS